ncbi:MAG: polyprenyl diphosphate synthase [Solirubrobacterales bacterium]
MIKSAARYIAIITDGNGRWAEQRELPVYEGHRAGAKVAMERLQDAIEAGVEEMTSYSFSTENWSRPREEVEGLMKLAGLLIESEVPWVREAGVRVRFLGRRGEFTDELRERLDWAEKETADNDTLTLFVAFNYGGRMEIVDAARSFTGSTEEEFRQHLYLPEMHDPDMVIRTSGERRLSNFLPWQSAYSELVFRDELWPDFTSAAFEECLLEFEGRQRRFGARA